MLPINRKISKYNHTPKGNMIKYIVIHDTGNITDSDEGNAAYFAQNGRKASAHYFVDDNSITQIVNDIDCAWHVGDGRGKFGISNRNSLGVEMCRKNNDVTALTEKNTLELVKYLMEKYKVTASNVVRHYDASRKNCPSSFSGNDWERWVEFKGKLG